MIELAVQRVIEAFVFGLLTGLIIRAIEGR